MFLAVFVCLFVCQHENFRTSKHRMVKLGGTCVVQKSRPSSNLGVIAPLGMHPPQNVALGYDVGKVSAGCLVCLYICSVAGIFCVMYDVSDVFVYCEIYGLMLVPCVCRSDASGEEVVWTWCDWLISKEDWDGSLSCSISWWRHIGSCWDRYVVHSHQCNHGW